MIGEKALAVVQSWWPEVKAVRDATKAVIITVTAKHAKIGVPGNPEMCSNSLACRGLAGKERIVSGRLVERALTTKTVTYLRFGNIALRYINPVSLREKVVSKDTKDSFQPGSYVLSPACESHKLGPRRYAQPNRDRQKNLKTGKFYRKQRRRQESRRPQSLEAFAAASH